MGSHVLLQVIFPAETLSTNYASVRTKSGVDSLVPRQLFVPGKRFPAILRVAFERSFACVIDINILTHRKKKKKRNYSINLNYDLKFVRLVKLVTNFHENSNNEPIVVPFITYSKWETKIERMLTRVYPDVSL